MSKISTFIKNHKKLIIICAITIITIVLGYFLTVSINNAVITNRAQKFLDEKIFLCENGIWTSAYKFDGNKMFKESWCSSDQSQYGSINDGHKYKVTNTIGSNEIQFWYKDDNKWWYGPKAVVQKNGILEFTDTGEWYQANLEEIDTIRKVSLCKHEYGRETITVEATCSASGEKVHTCKICDFTETLPILQKEHNYKNKICTECGKEKQPQKDYSVQPDTWYVYNNVLHYQNCRITTADGSSSYMFAQYYAVCQNCHCICDMFAFAEMTVNNPVNRIYTCDYCGGKTLIKFKIG